MEETTPSRPRFPWQTLIIAATLIVVGGLALFFFAASRAGTFALQRATEIAAGFKTGTITRTFIQDIPQISSTHGDVLELATSRSTETFTQTDSKSVFWDTIYLGTTVSEIRVPVVFRYHILLSDKWQLAAKDQVCLVQAPAIRPSLPPAIQTDLLEKSTANGWARFNKDENLSALERSLTPTLSQRATDPRHLRLVREACRQSIAEFVKKWLMKEDHWRSDRFSSIVVVFPDEAALQSPQELEQFRYEPSMKSN